MKNKIKYLFIILTTICLLYPQVILAGATFTRVTNWSSGQTLTAAALNSEFNNVLNNFDPDGLDDASANATAMQATADPYPGSAASLATDLRGELQRLRYVIKQITGETYWYVDPDFAISDVTSTAAELNILDGVTSTTAELNILDGATLNVNDLNVLDGAADAGSLTSAELMILDGATLNVNDLNVIDGIADSGSLTAAELMILDGATLNVNDLNIIDGLADSGSLTAAELMILDGVTATTSEINTVADGITATAVELNSVADGIPSHSGATLSSATITSSYTERDDLDLGTLTAGDFFIIDTMLTGTKGATAGTVMLGLAKKSGTATVTYVNGYQATWVEHYCGASTGVSINLCMVGRVTVGGTYVLQINARSNGSDTTNTDIQTGAVFIKQQ